MSDKCLHFCFSKGVDNLLAAAISSSESAPLLHCGSGLLTAPERSKALGILLPRELGDGKQLLRNADGAGRHGWALHPAGAVGPAARAPGAPYGVRAALPAPALLENHYPSLALLNRYIG